MSSKQTNPSLFALLARSGPVRPLGILVFLVKRASMSIGMLSLFLVVGTGICVGSGSVAHARGSEVGLSDSLRPTQSHPAQDTSPSPAAGISNLDTCFSPDEGCDQKLISFIQSARSTLDIAIYSITHEGITSAINDAKARGVTVRMVVDKREAKGKGSSVEGLVSSGVPVKLGNVHGIMHDKFTIVDGAMIETGSFNYSMNATSENAENQLYLTDANVIQRYQGNFEKLWSSGISQ